jgi:hypothetical protein
MEFIRAAIFSAGQFAKRNSSCARSNSPRWAFPLAIIAGWKSAMGAAAMAKVKRLGSLDSIGGCINALGKIARSMWCGDVDSSDGHRVASVVRMIREAIEADTLQKIQERLDRLEGKPDA